MCAPFSSPVLRKLLPDGAEEETSLAARLAYNGPLGICYIFPGKHLLLITITNRIQEHDNESVACSVMPIPRDTNKRVQARHHMVVNVYTESPNYIIKGTKSDQRQLSNNHKTKLRCSCQQLWNTFWTRLSKKLWPLSLFLLVTVEFASLRYEFSMKPRQLVNVTYRLGD